MTIATTPAVRHDCHTENLLKRITVDPQICHEKPTVRGMRYPVGLILELLSAGMAREEILADYPGLEPEDISAKK